MMITFDQGLRDHVSVRFAEQSEALAACATLTRGATKRMWANASLGEEVRMNGLEPLVTVYSGTGAFRAITSDLLAETYLALRPPAVDLNSVLVDGAFPWSASMSVSPLETAAAVSAALRSLAAATQGLNPDAGSTGRNPSSWGLS